jgi:hypothetical protein
MASTALKHFLCEAATSLKITLIAFPFSLAPIFISEIWLHGTANWGKMLEIKIF